MVCVLAQYFRLISIVARKSEWLHCCYYISTQYSYNKHDFFIAIPHVRLYCQFSNVKTLPDTTNAGQRMGQCLSHLLGVHATSNVKFIDQCSAEVYMKY